MQKLKPSDILLFPVSLFKKFNDNKYSAIPGILAIGIVDVIVPLFILSPEVFIGKSSSDLTFNIAAALLAMVIIGIADIVFFSMPLYDVFAWVGRRSKMDFSMISFIKPVKIYMMAHAFIIPLNIALMALIKFAPAVIFLTILDLYFTFIVPVWFAAVIYRGMNAVYAFAKEARRLVFVLILVWSLVLSYALEYIVSDLLINVFR